MTRTPSSMVDLDSTAPDFRLPDVVTDIVAENGNSLYQPLVDEYIAGGNVPRWAVMARASAVRKEGVALKELWTKAA